MARHIPTVEEGQAALKGHVVERAAAARARHGAPWDRPALDALLGDEEVVRFPTRLVFDAEPLLAGEFAWARPRGERPRDGFDLVVHPRFRERPADLVLLVAYHVPSINYVDISTHIEAELFGSTLLGLDVDTYYERVCALADELPGLDASPEHVDMARAWLDEAAGDGGGDARAHGGDPCRGGEAAPAPAVTACQGGGGGSCGCGGAGR